MPRHNVDTESAKLAGLFELSRRLKCSLTGDAYVSNSGD